MANTPLRLLTTTLRPSPEIATASASSVRLSVSQSRRRTEKHQRHFSLPAVQSVSRSPVFITLVVRPPVCAGFGPEASFARSLSLSLPKLHVQFHLQCDTDFTKKEKLLWSRLNLIRPIHKVTIVMISSYE